MCSFSCIQVSIGVSHQQWTNVRSTTIVRRLFSEVSGLYGEICVNSQSCGQERVNFNKMVWTSGRLVVWTNFGTKIRPQGATCHAKRGFHNNQCVLCCTNPDSQGLQADLRYFFAGLSKTISGQPLVSYLAAKIPRSLSMNCQKHTLAAYTINEYVYIPIPLVYKIMT